MTNAARAGRARPCAYSKYKAPFLEKDQSAQSKELLTRDEDVQVLHGFDSVANVKAHLKAACSTTTSSPA